MEYQRVAIGDLDGYEIDTNGEVWSCWGQKRLGWRYGAIAVKTDKWHKIKPQLITPGKTKNQKYWQVGVMKNGKQIGRSVHRLVATAFIKNPSRKRFVCHKDSNPLNNQISNLYWGDQTDNMRDRKARGLYGLNYGENIGGAKLKETQVLEIVRLFNDLSNYKISKIYGVAPATIRDIRNKTTWKHLTK